MRERLNQVVKERVSEIQAILRKPNRTPNEVLSALDVLYGILIALTYQSEELVTVEQVFQEITNENWKQFHARTRTQAYARTKHRP
jgi:hypothetical protein